MSCGEGSGAVILRRCEADSQASGNIWNVSHPSSSLSKTIISLDKCEAHKTAKTTNHLFSRNDLFGLNQNGTCSEGNYNLKSCP